MSYATIGAVVGMSRKTVRRHVHSLISRGLIQADGTVIRRRDGRSYNGSFLYTVKPIERILKKRENEFLAELKLARARRRWDRHCHKREALCGPLWASERHGERARSNRPNGWYIS